MRRRHSRRVLLLWQCRSWGSLHRGSKRETMWTAGAMVELAVCWNNKAMNRWYKFDHVMVYMIDLIPRRSIWHWLIHRRELPYRCSRHFPFVRTIIVDDEDSRFNAFRGSWCAYPSSLLSQSWPESSEDSKTTIPNTRRLGLLMHQLSALDFSYLLLSAIIRWLQLSSGDWLLQLWSPGFSYPLALAIWSPAGFSYDPMASAIRWLLNWVSMYRIQCSIDNPVEKVQRKRILAQTQSKRIWFIGFRTDRTILQDEKFQYP